jgi:acetyl-CoA acyltransferase
MREVVVVSSVRTPVGRAFKGTLRATRPDEMAAIAIKGALDRVPQVDPKEIEDVILGCAMPEAEQGMNVARIASLRAGLPVEVSAVTINRFCHGGRAHHERRRRGDGRGRDGIDVDDPHGREQDFA